MSIKLGSSCNLTTGIVAQILIIEQFFLIMKMGPGVVVLSFFKSTIHLEMHNIELENLAPILKFLC